MFALSSVFLLVIVSVCCYGQSTNRVCAPDTVDFATKVNKSSVVVYGKSMAKMMNEGSDSVFHVFFQVDCILKGPATLRQINITNAGRVEGKTYCQEYPVGRDYTIAFLEPIPSNETDYQTFIPADFVEVTDVKNSSAALLARTCNLNRIVPRQSVATVADVCPIVSTDPACVQTNNASIATVITTNVPANSSTVIVAGVPVNSSNETVVITKEEGHMSHPIHSAQQELEAIRSKSGAKQVDVDYRNNAQSVTFNLFLTIIAIFFCLY